MKSFLVTCGLLVQIWSVYSARKPSGPLKIDTVWIAPPKVCDGTSKDYFNFDNLKVTKTSATQNVVDGSLQILKPIEDGTKACIYVYKKLDGGGDDLALTFRTDNLCDQVADMDQPWTFAFDALKLDPRSCPIPAKTYDINSVKLNLTPITEQLKSDSVGDYTIRTTLSAPGSGDACEMGDNVISCISADIQVIQY